MKVFSIHPDFDGAELLNNNLRLSSKEKAVLMLYDLASANLEMQVGTKAYRRESNECVGLIRAIASWDTTLRVHAPPLTISQENKTTVV